MEEQKLRELQKLLAELQAREPEKSGKKIRVNAGDVYVLQVIYHLRFNPEKALSGLSEAEFQTIYSGFSEIFDDFKTRCPKWSPSAVFRKSGGKTDEKTESAKQTDNKKASRDKESV